MLAKNSFNTKSDGSESSYGFESFKTSSKSKSSLPFLTGIDYTRVGMMRDNEISGVERPKFDFQVHY